MLVYFSSALFYTDNIHLPQDHHPLAPEIQDNPEIFPFFENALSTMDGTHLNCNPTAADQQLVSNCKVTVTQNCLAVSVSI